MESFLFSALGLGSLMAVLNLNKTVITLTEKLNKVQSSPTFLPEGLISWLKKNLDNSEILSQYGFQKSSNPDEIVGEVFLKGIASTKHPIRSKLRPEIPLIYSNYFINKIYSNNINDRVHSREEILRQTLYPNLPNSLNDCLIDGAPYFNLYDYVSADGIKPEKKTDFFCRIARNLNLDARGAMRYVASKIYYKTLSLVERLIVCIYLILEAAFSRQATIKGIRIG